MGIDRWSQLETQTKHSTDPVIRKKLCSIKSLIGTSHNRSVPRHGYIGAAAAYHAAAAKTKRDTAAAQ